MKRRANDGGWVLAAALCAIAACHLDTADRGDRLEAQLARRDTTRGFAALSTTDRAEADALAVRYAAFIDAGRTPRAVVAEGRAMLERGGFVDLEGHPRVREGDRVFFSPQAKVLAGARIGAVGGGFRVIIVAIDAPRLDLKPSGPWVESGAVLVETQFYGPMDKKQWLSWPMMLQADVSEEGAMRSVRLGDDAGEPVFVLPDLLIHLSRKAQRDRVIDGEGMNAVVGFAAPGQEDGGTLRGFAARMQEELGLSPEAFATGEFALLPATKPEFVGVDRGMLAAYGHRFRAVLYVALEALMASEGDETVVVVTVDRTAIGGTGNGGYGAVRDVLGELNARMAPHEDGDELGLRRRLSRSMAWVTVPIGGEVGRGVVFDARSDDSLPGVRRATFDALDGARVPYQLSTAPGWSPARQLATMGFEVMDFAIPVAGVGAPMELISVSDLLATRRAVLALAEAPPLH